MQFRLGDTTASTDTSGGMADAATAQPSWLTSLIQGFAQYKLGQNQLNTAQQLTALNIQRAQHGLPPIVLDPSATGAPGVSVGLAAGTQQLLTYALIGGGLLLAANVLLKAIR